MTDAGDNTAIVPRCRVVIAGGGIAGLYAAYRLRQAWLSDDEGPALAQRLGITPDKHGRSLLRVAILERDPVRLGGRLRSVEIPFPHGSVIAELGAMRFAPRQQLVRNLIADLGVSTMPFASEDFATRYYLRGKLFDDAAIARNEYPSRFPYDVAPTEARKSPGELVLMVLDHALRELVLDDQAPPEALLVLEKLHARLSRAEISRQEWALIQKHGLLNGDTHLDQIGMWNLIHHYLSHDAARLVEDGFGYESIIGNWNASDAIPWFLDDFRPGQGYETVVGSFAELVQAISRTLDQRTESRTSDRSTSPKSALRREFRCTTHCNMTVRAVAIGDRRDGTVQVTYTKGKRGAAPADGEDEKVRLVRARAVILALPKDALQRVSVEHACERGAHDRWKADLGKVRAHRLVKIVHAYRHPWWHKGHAPGAGAGRVFTDLPLRQVYYFDRAWLEERGRYRVFDAAGHLTPAQGRSNDQFPPPIGGIVTAYLDGHHAAFWRFITAVERIEDPDEPRRRELFGDRVWAWREPSDLDTLFAAAPKNWTAEKTIQALYFRRYGLHSRLAHKVTHILQQLHDGAAVDGIPMTVPLPDAGASVFWDDYSSTHEAGWHTWEPGVQSADVIRYLSKPFDADVFVCGEAYSSDQGWIEGALKSTELVLDRLGLRVRGEPPTDVRMSGAATPPSDAARKMASQQARRARDYVGLPPRPAPDTVPAAASAFRPAVAVPIADDRALLFLSGVIGIPVPTPLGGPAHTQAEPAPDVDEQTRRAVQRLLTVLAEHGGRPHDLASVRIFVASMDHYQRVNTIYRDALGTGGFPARTVIAASALPFGALVEIDAVAAIPITPKLPRASVIISTLAPEDAREGPAQ